MRTESGAEHQHRRFGHQCSRFRHERDDATAHEQCSDSAFSGTGFGVQDIKEKISAYRAERNELRKIYLPENSHMTDNQAQIAAAEQQKKQMERDNPGLIMAVTADSIKPGDTGAPTISRFVDESAQIAALQKENRIIERTPQVRPGPGFGTGSQSF